DFAWSGQSIEHVSREDAVVMCDSIYRILKPGGRFCLDTPNRLVTAIHTRNWHGGYINPDHRYEYAPDELRSLLLDAGFRIDVEAGINAMVNTCETGNFDYTDFVLGNPLTDRIEEGYSLFFAC